MAVGDFLGSLKNSVKTAYDNFFYNGRRAPQNQGEQQPNQGAQDQAHAPHTGTYQQPYQQAGAYQQQPYQQAGAYQQPYQQAGAYQQPYQQAGAYQQQPYQQAGAYQQQPYQQAGAYQQQPYQQTGAYQQQPYQQTQTQQSAAGNRAAANTAPQQTGQGRRRSKHGENVVDFSAFQQSVNRQNGQAPEQQQAAQETAQQSGSLLSARVISARSMGDCRSAITLLRNGDAVVIVMENITDPGEMRRLVDTLSGACYSLTATITKVSRSGVYLLAPQTLAVFADQATNMMNSAPVRSQPRSYQPAYSGQRVSYAPQQQEAQPFRPQPQPQQQPYGGGQGFAQRMAEPEEARQDFYQRPAPQEAQTPPFSAQPAGYGYTPDEVQAVDQ